MTISSPSPAVLGLAAAAGVLPEWVDAWGRQQMVAQDDLVAVLTAVTGAELTSDQAAVEATRAIVEQRPPIPEVIVAWDGRFPETAVGVDIQTAVLTTEAGDAYQVHVAERHLSFASPLPVGYHTLAVDDGRWTSHVFSAPTLAHPTPRSALGLIAPTYSLRSARRDAGLGALAELRGFVDLCRGSGVQVVGTLPLLAAFDDEPSPYSPASRRAWNELFVDLAGVPGWSADIPEAKEGSQWVDYESSGREIRLALSKYAEHVASTPRLRSNVDAYLDAEPEIRRYSTFRARTDVHGRDWRGWSQSAEAPEERVRYHETVQWLMAKQLSDLSSSMRANAQYLYLDLPIGCHPDGYDIWDSPDLFASASLGAPPDTLFVGGQDWGLPASIPSRARSDGHMNFRKAVRKQLSVAGLLRIDHVMGIHRTWWVPHGLAATQGAYVMQAADEMFAIISIESNRASVGVVGENLGTVPPEIHTGLAHHGLLGMAFVQNAVYDLDPTQLVAMSSHDSPSFSAWWAGLDIDDMLALGIFDPERADHERLKRAADIAQMQAVLGSDGPIDTPDALMRWMAQSPAAIALLNLDDLLLEDRRQNVPGTYRERPNWRLRYQRSVDELAADHSFVALLQSLSAARRRGPDTIPTSAGR
ncbi:MAG: 4-alpha-glucanotransferase [Acidimicrobiia bacterium]